jgi:hypothetical protein
VIVGFWSVHGAAVVSPLSLPNKEVSLLSTVDHELRRLLVVIVILCSLIVFLIEEEFFCLQHQRQGVKTVLSLKLCHGHGAATMQIGIFQLFPATWRLYYSPPQNVPTQLESNKRQNYTTLFTQDVTCLYLRPILSQIPTCSHKT